MDNDHRLLTTRDVAKLLQVSMSTLSKWRVSKREALPFLKLGRAVRYRLEDVQAHLHTRVRRSTSDTEPSVIRA